MNPGPGKPARNAEQLTNPPGNRGTKMQITKSTIKIAENEFNNCQGREDILRQIDYKGLKSRIEFVDLDRPNWKNAFDTLVFRVKLPARFEIGLWIGELSRDTGADWMNYFRATDNDFIIRFWWD